MSVALCVYWVDNFPSVEIGCTFSRTYVFQGPGVPVVLEGVGDIGWLYYLRICMF